MSDVQVLEQPLGASGDTNGPVLGADNTNDEDLSANLCEDVTDEAEIGLIRGRLERTCDLLKDAQFELVNIKQLLELHAHTDKETIDSLRQLGFRALYVSEYAHDIAADRLFRELNPHYTNIDPHVAYAKIDVHYLRLSQTEIICGWGKNSNGVGKIRAALIKEFRCTGVQFIKPPNRGRLIVFFNTPSIMTEDRAARWK
ncbi:hypothetical protein ACEPAG_4312 [Sanghuangporus baumii]